MMWAVIKKIDEIASALSCHQSNIKDIFMGFSSENLVTCVQFMVNDALSDLIHHKTSIISHFK